MLVGKDHVGWEGPCWWCGMVNFPELRFLYARNILFAQNGCFYNIFQHDLKVAKRDVTQTARDDVKNRTKTPQIVRFSKNPPGAEPQRFE